GRRRPQAGPRGRRAFGTPAEGAVVSIGLARPRARALHGARRGRDADHGPLQKPPMSAFTYEIATVTAAVTRAYPGHAEGIYAIPWYLILGDPGSGRSTALHAMNLSWSGNDGPLNTGLPQQLCTFWMPQEAVFIEPESQVLGPRRNPTLLRE